MGFSPTTRNILAGSGAGMASTIVCHPLDTIRTRLQTSKVPLTAVQCFRNTIAHEGVAGLYKGLSFPLAAQALYKSIMFTSFGFATRQITSKRPAAHILTPGELCVAGAFAGGLNSAVVTPIELVRNRLMVQTHSSFEGTDRSQAYSKEALRTSSAARPYTTVSSAAKPHYRGPFDAVKQIVAQYGVSGMWKGLRPTLMRDMPGVGAYYATHTLATRALTEKFTSVNTDGVRSELPVAYKLIAGSMAGVGFWSVALPFDTLKSRFQTDTQKQYNGVVDCARHLFREGGVKGFYKGWSVAFSRGIPGAAVTFYAFGQINQSLEQL